MKKLVEKLKEFGKYEVGYNEWAEFLNYVRNFKDRDAPQSDDVPKFMIKQALNLSEIIFTYHAFSNGQNAKGIATILAFEAVKYGLHKLVDEYLPQNKEKLINFLEKYFGKKNPQ